MNKRLYEHFIQVMTANGGYFGFDTWGLPENAEIYRLLTGKKLVEIEGKVYTIAEVGAGGKEKPKVLLYTLGFFNTKLE